VEHKYKKFIYLYYKS